MDFASPSSRLLFIFGLVAAALIVLLGGDATQTKAGEVVERLATDELVDRRIMLGQSQGEMAAVASVADPIRSAVVEGGALAGMRHYRC